jgi:hypothetical protein
VSAGQSAFKLAFELSPIILVGGIASLIPFQMMPIMAITEAINLPLGLLGSSGDVTLDNFFAHYQPLPGASMIEQDIATYPFANQQVAAASVITKPLSISFQMTSPAKGAGGYYAKLPIMMLLQRTLEKHNASGGTYTLLTPSFIYTNCLMLSMRDTSTAATRQVQNTWQLDFVKPLVTIADAQSAEGALNNLMQQFDSGSQITGQPSLSGLSTGGAVPADTGAAVPVAGGTSPVAVPGYSDSGFGANTPVAASESGFTANTPAAPAFSESGFGAPQVSRR